MCYDTYLRTKGIFMTMRVISYTQLRQKLADEIGRVNDNHAPVLITRQNGQRAVLMSLEDFMSYEETAYLLASPKNAERLRRSIAQVKTGKTKNRQLLED